MGTPSGNGGCAGALILSSYTTPPPDVSYFFAVPARDINPGVFAGVRVAVAVAMHTLNFKERGARASRDNTTLRVLNIVDKMVLL